MIVVSIIIPNYNHEKFLQKRIESILAQTFQSYELIILDDCSLDGSKEIIERYCSHPKVSHVIYNEYNSGCVFKQWERGIKLAKGDYIWFAESDDFAEATFLEKMVPLLNINPKVGMIFCNSHVFDSEDSVYSNTNNWTSTYVVEQGKNKVTYFNGLQFCLDHLFYLCRIPNASAVLFRRELVANNLEWIDTTLKNSGDWKLWLNICLKSDIIWFNEDLNYFRIHGSNFTSSIALLKSEAIIILKELIKKDYNFYRVYESLAAWSFKSGAWLKEHHINLTNIKIYFKNNFSFKSSAYLTVYFLKQLLINGRNMFLRNRFFVRAFL